VSFFGGGKACESGRVLFIGCLFVICFNAQSSVASSRSDFKGNEMGACNFLCTLLQNQKRNHLRDSTPYVTYSPHPPCGVMQLTVVGP
jgi:hypothetical protein